MINYHAVVFWTDSSNFDSVKHLLKSQFGLVNPKEASEERLKRQLVWENNKGIGIYRVNFSKGQKELQSRLTDKGRCPDVPEEFSGPKIIFRYWSKRLDKKTISEDTMKDAYLATYALIKPVAVTDFYCKKLI